MGAERQNKRDNVHRAVKKTRINAKRNRWKKKQERTMGRRAVSIQMEEKAVEKKERKSSRSWSRRKWDLEERGKNKYWTGIERKKFEYSPTADVMRHINSRWQYSPFDDGR